MLGRAPMAIVLALIRLSRRDLQVISLPNLAEKTGSSCSTAPDLPVTELLDARSLDALRAIDSDNLRHSLVG